MKTRLIVLFFIQCLFAVPLNAQYYDIGQEPASINWRQVNSTNFRVLFPDYFETGALETAKMLEQWRIPISRSLNVLPPKTPVVLHTGNIYSNAYAIWAPRRLEFLTIPPQDLYGQPWLDQLVLHEYRHIVQITAINQGFTRFLSLLFGQQAAPAIIGLFIPPWFMEGDAVAIETALSHSGRGRVANFAMPLRAQLLGKGQYPYVKATLGSFRDFVPNHYIMGYHIVATSRAEFGTALWESAISRTARLPFTLNPFSKGIHMVSGLHKKDMYIHTMKTLDSLWRKDSVKTNFEIITHGQTPVYTNYQHPFEYNQGIIALRNSLDKIARLVSIDPNGEEEIIHLPGYMIDNNIAFNGTYLSWTEHLPHVRWQNQGYAIIVLFNPASGKDIRIKSKLKLFSPTVSPNNEVIAAAQASKNGQFSLALLSLSGNIIHETPTPDNMMISLPSWAPDGKRIACILTGKNGKRIAEYKVNDHEFSFVTPILSDEISFPVHLGDKIIFNMDIDEKSEVCSIELSSGELHRITFSEYGTTQPSVKNDKLLISVYTPDGYRIAKVHNNQLQGNLISDKHNNIWPLANELGIQEASLSETNLPPDDFTIRNYSKANLLNIHSWAPVYIDIDDQTVRPGISLQSQNLLSTFFVTTGWDYNIEEEAGQFKALVHWRGWFPEIITGFTHGNRSAYSGRGDTAYRFLWQETSWDLAIAQRLNYLQGIYSIGAYFEAKHQLVNTIHRFSTPTNFREGIFSALGYSASGYIISKRAYRDLAPPKGASLSMHFKHSPYGDYRAGKLMSAQSRFYLPGLWTNHSFQLYAGYQFVSASSDGYRFAGDIGILAGYGLHTPNEILRLRPSYSFPLAYPDFNIGTAFYLKRIQSTLFYDHSFAKYDTWSTFAGTGVDVSADFHLLGLSTPFNAGIRTIYLNQSGEIEISLIFSVNLYEY